MKIFLAAATFMFANCALAGPDESIATTYADAGLRQVDFKLGSISRSGQPRGSAATFGFGGSITERWFSELYASYIHNSGQSTSFDAFALQNTFLLTHGQYPIDIGLYTEIEHPQDRSEGEQFTFGPLLQTEFGRLQVNANLLFQRNYRADLSNRMQLNYQWQIKHHWKSPFGFGLQGFGELGEWDHWAARSEQSHRLGPALFWKKNISERKIINFNAAILVDASDASHNTTFRAQAVYGF